MEKSQKPTTGAAAAYATLIKQIPVFRHVATSRAIAAYPDTSSTAKDASSATQPSWKSLNKAAMPNEGKVI